MALFAPLAWANILIWGVTDMSAGKIAHLSRAKGAFIEFFFKPATLAGAILILPFMRWASPAKSQILVDLRQAGRETAREIWGPDDFPPRYKTDIIIEIFTEFLEADNAYMIFFDRIAKKYAEKRGWLYDENKDKGKKEARTPADSSKGKTAGGKNQSYYVAGKDGEPKFVYFKP